MAAKNLWSGLNKLDHYNMNNPKNMSFHEATVVRFLRRDSVLELELEDVLVGDLKLRVILSVSPVFSVETDSVSSNIQLMEADDGEVLTLEFSNHNMLLIVEWNDFSLKKSFTRSYQVVGGGISVSVI